MHIGHQFLVMNIESMQNTKKNNQIKKIDNIIINIIQLDIVKDCVYRCLWRHLEQSVTNYNSVITLTYLCIFLKFSLKEDMNSVHPSVIVWCLCMFFLWIGYMVSLSLHILICVQCTVLLRWNITQTKIQIQLQAFGTYGDVFTFAVGAISVISNIWDQLEIIRTFTRLTFG